jgi:hypothetical protein
MGNPLGDPSAPADRPLPPAPPRKTRSILGNVFHGAGWMATGPVDWLGTRRIVRSASFIGALWSLLRSGPRRDARLKTEPGRGFDLQATAFSYGISVKELAARFDARRRQTARLAYATFAMAWLFLLAWIWQALLSPWTATRVSSMVYFLPFCALFFLVAFYNALLNYQMRTGRLATWREYLSTSDRFWPS